MTFRNAGTYAVNARVRPDKVFCPPRGIDGGQDGKTGSVIYNGEVITEFPILRFEPGHVIELRMPGGAGFGDPRERDPEAIERDIAAGIVTVEGAERDYGYVARGRA